MMSCCFIVLQRYSAKSDYRDLEKYFWNNFKCFFLFHADIYLHAFLVFQKALVWVGLAIRATDGSVHQWTQCGTGWSAAARVIHE